MKTPYFAALIVFASAPAFAQVVTYTLDPSQSNFSVVIQRGTDVNGNPFLPSLPPLSGSLTVNRDFTTNTLQIISGEIYLQNIEVGYSFLNVDAFPITQVSEDYTIYNTAVSLAPNGTTGAMTGNFTAQTTNGGTVTGSPIILAPTISDVGNSETLTFQLVGGYLSEQPSLPKLLAYQEFGTFAFTTSISPEPTSLTLLALPALALLRRKRHIQSKRLRGRSWPRY